MLNVKAHAGDMEMTCAGSPSELIADICCIIKAIGDGVPEGYRDVFFTSLYEVLGEVCTDVHTGN